MHLSYASPNTRGPGRWPSRLASLGLIALTVAATAIGWAIYLQRGEYTPTAIGLVTLAIVAAVGAVFCSRWNDAGVEHPVLDWVVATAFTLQFIALFRGWPVDADRGGSYSGRLSSIEFNRFLYFNLLAIAAFILMLGLLRVKRLRRWWFPALLIVHGALSFWTIRCSPMPHIDVWYFQEQSADVLLRGHNPYDARQVQFADIYHSTVGNHQRVYGEGMVVDDRLRFGFPYPPLSLYCSTAGIVASSHPLNVLRYALTRDARWLLLDGDTRYAQALALLLAGVFIGYGRSGHLAKCAAALLLFTPSEWFVLEQAWTEPFVVMFLGATIFCACRNLGRLLPIALGLFLASKQYLAFAVPLSILLIPNFAWDNRASWWRWGKLLLKAAIVAAIVTLPLALWDWHAFWLSTVTVQEKAPFRWDALSYLVWIGFNIHSKYTAWVWLAFVVVVPALLFSLWKAARTPGGFAAAMGLVYLVFIAFNKQAFCNYYFFVIGCFCCAIAAAGKHMVNSEPGI